MAQFNVLEETANEENSCGNDYSVIFMLLNFYFITIESTEKLKREENKFIQALAVIPRITSIDFLRGIVMIIMALDYVREYFLADSLRFDPEDLSQTTPMMFFTRWITHLCAPVFVFLAGTPTFLSGQRKTKKEMSFFLLTRGLWLLLLEVTVVNFGCSFNI